MNHQNTLSSLFGFNGSALMRVALAVVYVLAAFSAVYIVSRRLTVRAPVPDSTDRNRSEHADSTPDHGARIVTVQITAESTFSVSGWTLIADGKPIVPAASSAYTAHFEITVPDSNREIVIEAEADDPLDDAAHVLRVTVSTPDGEFKTVHWGNGDLTVYQTLTPRAASDSGRDTPH